MVSDNTLIKMEAIGSIALLECIALYKGIDGIILSTVIAVISGIAGYTIKGLIRGR